MNRLLFVAWAALAAAIVAQWLATGEAAPNGLAFLFAIVSGLLIWATLTPRKGPRP